MNELVFRHPILPLWRAPAIFVVVFAPMVIRKFSKTPSAGLLIGYLVLLISIAAVQLLGLAYLLTVKVTDDGIFGPWGKGLRWSEMERTAPPTMLAYLGGFRLQSMHRNAVHVPLAIARNPEFQQAVLAKVPAAHPIVEALAAVNAKSSVSKGPISGGG